MKNNFNHLSWQDANLMSIYIDRQNPGEMDVIKIVIEWENSTLSSIFEFFDCYAFIANMNFGVLANESILYAECINDSQELKSIQEKWLKAGLKLENLKHFKIETNSTNSIINIFSLGYRKIDLNKF